MRGGTLSKVERIKQELRKEPDGLWLRELARRCNLLPGSVYYLIKRHMPKCKFVKVAQGNREKALITMIKLIE